MSIQESLFEIEDLFSIFDDPKDKFIRWMISNSKGYEGHRLNIRTRGVNVGKLFTTRVKEMFNYSGEMYNEFK